MGILSRFVKQNARVSADFINIVRALDNHEPWAEEAIQEMWNSNDTSLVPRMDAARIQIYEKAAYGGDRKAQYWMGVSLRGTDMAESLRWLTQLADQGNVDAMKAIAIGYTPYGGYGENEAQYKYWYKRAAEAGDGDSQAALGLECICEEDFEEAYKWYKMAAEQKNPKGLLGLAQLYERKRSLLSMENTYPLTERRKDERDESRFDDIIENLYVEAANRARDRNEMCEACSKLGHFYKRLLICKSPAQHIAKLAAYFLYSAYLYGNENELRWFQEVVNHYNITVDTHDIEAWADSERLFG